MEGDAKSSENRNDALSQSYIQGVERLAHRSNDDAGFSFNLPPEIIEKREKVWSSFFDKYADEASDDLELDIKTMKPATSASSAHKNDAEVPEHTEYTKCRAPIRKLPALIQYWVDTGNPPYQLTGEDYHSDTGSSLSEGDYSRSRQSAVLRDSIENPKPDEFSPCSSVDTAAYVLSNANVTKKSQTQGIVEGFSRSKEQLPSELLSAIESATDATLSVEGAPIPRNDTLNTPQSQGSSVMLSEVLPALQQFDELLEKSKKLKSPRSALSKVRRITKPAVEEPKLASDARKSSFNSSETGARRTLSLRKLYTGRNSPVDLIVARTSTESTVTTGAGSHPALEPDEGSKSQVPSFVSRARARRKRKRTSGRRYAGMTRQGRDWEGSQPGPDEGKKGNGIKGGRERYTDFFESLGLTPSKTIIGRDEIGGHEPNSEGKIARMMKDKGNGPRIEAEESSTKESRNIADRANDGYIIGNKVPSVRIVRLPENFFYRGVKAPSLGDRTDERNLNIELLTTMTHESDSSTILICSCNSSNDQYSNSDCSLFARSIDRQASENVDRNGNFETSQSASAELRSSQSPSRIYESTKGKSSIERIPKPSGVEKIANEVPNVTERRNEMPRGSSRINRRVSYPVAKTNEVDPSESTRTETACVTIGSRVFGESSQLGVSKLKRAKITRGSFDRSFGMCLDDEDDSFARLVKEFGSRGLERSKKGEGIIDDKINASKVPEDETPRPRTRSRVVAKIASSDGNEDDLTKVIGTSERTSRKIDRKSTRDLPNGEEKREKAIGNVKNSTNNGVGIFGSKNRHEKPIGESNGDEVSMKSNGKFDSTGPEAKNMPGKSKQVDDIFGTRDQAGSKNARNRSNFARRERNIPRNETVDKPTRVTRSARFHTLLNSDANYDSEDENSVIIERRGRANRRLNRENLFNDEISTDRKTTVDESRDGGGKSAREDIDEPIGEFPAVPEVNGQSSRLLPPSCDSSSKASTEEETVSHSRGRRKGEPRFKPVARRKGRRTRILGTPIESESDEDERKKPPKIQTNDDGTKLKRLLDTTVDNNGREKRPKRSINLFSYIFDDIVEDVDLIFSGNGDCQATINDHKTRNSNLETPKIRKNVMNARESTRTFRTRLSCGSDDENLVL